MPPSKIFTTAVQKRTGGQTLNVGTAQEPIQTAQVRHWIFFFSMPCMAWSVQVPSTTCIRVNPEHHGSCTHQITNSPGSTRHYFLFPFTDIKPDKALDRDVRVPTWVEMMRDTGPVMHSTLFLYASSELIPCKTASSAQRVHIEVNVCNQDQLFTAATLCP